MGKQLNDEDLEADECPTRKKSLTRVVLIYCKKCTQVPKEGDSDPGASDEFLVESTARSRKLRRVLSHHYCGCESAEEEHAIIEVGETDVEEVPGVDCGPHQNVWCDLAAHFVVGRSRRLM